MNSQAASRHSLADAQAALVASLLDNGPAPEGFVGAELHDAARSLRFKRARAAARSWPRLRDSLEVRWTPLFLEYAATHPLPAEGGSLADGQRFVRWLEERGQLTVEGWLEWQVVRLCWQEKARGMKPRRGMKALVAWRGGFVVAGWFIHPLGRRWYVWRRRSARDHRIADHS